MARIRSINPAAPSDEDVATMSIWAKYVWAYLPCHADADGRLQDKPFSLKLDILPTESVDMDAVLGELAARRHIIRYEVDGRKYIQIRSFAKHQRPHKNEASRGFPPPLVVSLGECPEPSGKNSAETLRGPDLWGPGSGVWDPENGGPVASAPAIPSVPVGATLPEPPKFWTAADWLSRFTRQWSGKYQRVTYGEGREDAVASGDFSAALARLPADERLAAQALAPDMIAEYLADEAPGRVKARHPWKWFVADFNSFRVPKVETSKGPCPPFGRAPSTATRDAFASILANEKP